MTKKQVLKDLQLCCEGIQNEITTLLIETWKSVENLTREEFCKALLLIHDFDVLQGPLCRKIQDVFPKEVL